MDAAIIKKLIVAVTVGFLAIFLGITIADADYIYLAGLIYVAIGVAAVITPGTSALLALGLLAPFSLPLPVVQGFPFALLITLLCYLKLFLTRLLTQRGERLPTPRVHWLIGVFFAWVALRYAMNPALPNIAGIGSDVTGFRSYLHYGTSFILMLGMPWFLSDRSAIERFLRWCGILSLVFSILFILLSFTRSMGVVLLLNQLGMFVSTFDNGMLRFVTLPAFGLMLISLSLIPGIIDLSATQRKLYLAVGLLAVIWGGSRSGFLMLYVLMLAIAIGRRKLVQLAYWTAVFVACFFAFRYVGENLLPRQQNVGVLRILSIASDKVAARTDAAANTLWRQIRWERAVQEIRSRPLVGIGYGGLDRAFIFASREEYEQSRLEVDVASGNIHNGYLSAAMALGIPAGLVFLAILSRQLLIAAMRALRPRSEEDGFLSAYHTFCLAQIAVIAVAILIGMDINRAVVWWWIQFAALPNYLQVLKQKPVETPAPAKPLKAISPVTQVAT